MVCAGRACSNVFDGDKNLDSQILHGVHTRCQLGLLTLFEWYKYIEVGRHDFYPLLLTAWCFLLLSWQNS